MTATPHAWSQRAGATLAAGIAACAVVGVLSAWADPVSGHLMHAAALVLTAIWLGAAALGMVPLKFNWLLALLLAPALVAAAQLGMSRTAVPFETWNSATAWLARAGVFCVAFASFDSERKRRLFGEAAIWFGATLAALALLQWYTGHGKILWSIPTAHSSEVPATFLNRDHYSMLIELLLPIAVIRAISDSAAPLRYAVCAGLMFASVIACASRAGTAIVILEVIILLVALSFKGVCTYRRAAVLVASLLVLTAIGGWHAVWERFQLQDPFAYRREMLAATIQMIQAQPWAGHGLGTWPSVYPQYAVFDPPGIYMNHAHNDWAEWAAEGGIALSAVLAIFCASLAWRVRRAPWSLGLPAMCLHAAVDFPFQKAALALVFFTVAGIACAAARDQKTCTLSK